VHRAALAAVEARGAAEELAHHALHRRALGERVAVAAVRWSNEILREESGSLLAATLAPKAATPPLEASSAAFSKARMRAMVR
jgi:hypothetical protein